MPPLDENSILELGRNPIPGSAPCGQDTSDHEDYLFVLAELAKLDRIEAGPPDWPRAEQAAASILRSKSKDLEMAAALGQALYQRAAYPGLAAWLGMTKAMVELFWDGLFPERPRRRKALIEMVADRLTEGGWLTRTPPKPDEFDALDLCAGRLAELEAVLKLKLPDDPPDFKKFFRVLKDLCGKRPAPEKPAAAFPPADGSAPAAPTAASGEPIDRGSAISAVMGAASFLRKSDPADPIPYALVRAVKWSKIEMPASDAARYQIDSPETSLLETLEQQFAKQLWENLLKNAEAAFRTADPLWLDVQRYVAFSMRGLGAAYEKAYHAVAAATAGLVRRLGGGLFDLKFKNGKALCGGETRMWIESEWTAGGGSGGRPSASENGKLTETVERAKKLAGAGSFKEAVGALQEGLAGCTQRRERFMWRLRIAQLCFDSQRIQLAGPLLEECYDEVRRYGIDEWEPTLAVDVAEALYRCRKSVTSLEKIPSAESLTKVRESFAWLCQLDPVAALCAEPTGK